MFKILITAASSNSGKTAVTCGLLSLLKSMGKNPEAMKCGPDYIDPMFHRSVLGVRSSNIDLFLSPPEQAKARFEKRAAGAGSIVVEGVMGYYDGSSRYTAEASAYHVADLLGLPALLVVRPKGTALTLAAVIRGIAEFRPDSHIAGVLLNDCSKAYYEMYHSVLEQESGVPVLGYLPHMEEAVFESRHLGLYTAEEITDLSERIGRIAETMKKTVDLERLFAIGGTDCGMADGMPDAEKSGPPAPDREAVSTETGDILKRPARIAVARDEAFSFIYQETLDVLEENGAELLFFSPLHDETLPEHIGGLYLPGGYPELHAEALAGNESMRRSVREAVNGGLPTVAECGGFLYLGASLKDEEGREYPMAGVLPGRAAGQDHLVRFGYGHVTCDRPSLLFRPGESIPVHEFHYWDSSEIGSDLTLTKFSNGKTWRFGYANETLYAGFPHLYFSGSPALAERFVRAAEKKD